MAEGEWSWRETAPKWRHRQYGSFGEFDPFPAYGHDVKVIEETAELVAERCPPLWDVELFVANREEIGRSNGYSNCHEGGHYEGEDWVKDPRVGLIMLSGKRVPPHPAVSRYLTAHEYGHHVEWMLEHVRGSKHVHEGKVVAEYAKYRGLPDESLHHGSGGRWHDSATEVFACDFRIVACGIEAEYWPHPGVPHPRDLSLSADLWSWWAQSMTDLAAEPKR